MALLVAAAQAGVVEWSDVARTTGLPFDDVQERQLQRVELFDHRVEQRLRVAVRSGIVEESARCKRNPVRAAPTSSLTAGTTSGSRRARWAMEPPHASLTSLMLSRRNCSSR